MKDRIKESLKNGLLNEGRKGKRYKFDKLKDNKVELTDEEKAQAKRDGGYWENGDLAVWKSDYDGEIVYVTHTHRAFNTAKSIGAIINKFKNFIKGTS